MKRVSCEVYAPIAFILLILLVVGIVGSFTFFQPTPVQDPTTLTATVVSVSPVWTLKGGGQIMVHVDQAPYSYDISVTISGAKGRSKGTKITLTHATYLQDLIGRPVAITGHGEGTVLWADTLTELEPPA